MKIIAIFAFGFKPNQTKPSISYVKPFPIILNIPLV